MAELLRRAPPILIYTTVSAGLFVAVVARALDTYQNFFAAAFALSHSNGSILVMANTAFLLLYLFGRALQAMFFGQLRPVEIERLYQRGGFFVTDFMLAFATFREAFGISSGVMVSVLLFVKCFHWLLSDRIEAMDQLPYPGPSRLEHARLLALFFVLWACDSILLTYSLDAVMQQGIGLVVLFAAEYAILMVNLTQSLFKYALSVLEIRRAARVGGAIAPPWEEKPIYGFYIELSTAFVELAIYLTYFAIMSIYHSIPIYAIRDVYVAGSLFITRSLAFVRYKRAMQALDVFDTPTQQELDSKSDKTCIVCREELNAIPPEGAPSGDTPALPGSEPDTSNGPPKRLPCGHIFHRNCLRSWFERQLTCPTCRQRVDDKLARANVDVTRAGAGVAGNNQGGEPALPQPGVPGGAQANNRRAAANSIQRVHTTEMPQGQMREPLRFEGFYLQAGAFVPWVGGPLLARDPTQPNVPHRHTPAPQRARHPAAPSTQMPMPAPSVSSPQTATIQPPPTASATPTNSFVWPPSTSAAPSSSNPVGEKLSGEVKPKVEDDDEDDDESDSDSSAEAAALSAERRRLITEATLARTMGPSYQRLTPSSAAPSPTPTTLAVPTSTVAATDVKPGRNYAEAYGKYFAMQTESSTMPTDGAQFASSAKPISYLASRQSITSAPLGGEYNVRHDAPSFIPLFHSFHLPHYSAAVGPSRPWPLQKASLPTQTLPLPGQTTPQASANAVPPPQTHTNALGAMRTAPYPLRVTPQSPSPLQLQHHYPSMSPRPESLFARLAGKREPSPSQELSIQQLEVITRHQVEERLRVLENVKRMTQQCIDELMAVRGTLPNLETGRQRAEESKPVVIEPQSIFTAEPSQSSAARLEQASPIPTLALKSIGSMLADAKPIVEPGVVLAAEAPTAQPISSTPSTSNLMVVDPLSFSVTEESADVSTPIKLEDALTPLEAEIMPGGTEGGVPLFEGDAAESVH